MVRYIINASARVDMIKFYNEFLKLMNSKQSRVRYVKMSEILDLLRLFSDTEPVIEIPKEKVDFSVLTERTKFTD